MRTEVEARHTEKSELDSRALVSVFAAYTVSATLWLLFATAVGILMAFKFGAPEFGPGPWLTFGRLRPIHTNATFYDFASIALDVAAHTGMPNNCAADSALSTPSAIPILEADGANRTAPPHGR